MSEEAVVALLKFAGWSVRYIDDIEFRGWHIAPPDVAIPTIHGTAQDVLEYFLVHRRAYGTD